MVFVVYNLQMTDLIGHAHLTFHIICFTRHVNISLLWTVAIRNCEELCRSNMGSGCTVCACVCCIRMSIKQVLDACNSFTSFTNQIL